MQMLKSRPLPLKTITMLVSSYCALMPLAHADHPLQAEESLLTPQVSVQSARLKPLPAPASRTLNEHDKNRLRAVTSDTAAMLEGQPGISLYRAGGVSSLPSIHGLADDRIRIKVDGMDLISACANHMNPPLSYIDPANVEAIQVYAGISPVSLGGDSIAGTIVVDSAMPEFAVAGEDLITKGRISGFYRSNNNARGINLSATAATDVFSVRYTGSTVEANNYHAGDGFKAAGIAAASEHPGGNRGWLDADEVGSTAFKSENHALALGFKHDNHLFELKAAVQNIPYQGFPNQRMDMTDNDSIRFNLRYVGLHDWGKLEAAAYHERTRHSMNFGDDKLYVYDSAMMGIGSPVLGMPMETEGKNTGFRLQADVILSERDLIRVGSELQRYRLDDWWDPVANSMMMGPETFWNIHNGERDRYAVFGEWEARWNPNWTTQLGLRHETVKMDTGSVQAYNTMGGMMGYGTEISGAFNSADRSRNDHNLDFTALARFTPDNTQNYEAGYAIKTRSPNLYERYTWSYNNSMVMNMNNWVGDGNGYVGNLALDPETAHTISVSGNWHDAGQKKWQLKATPYITYVRDYIDAVECTELGFSCPARTDGFSNLTLDNQRARIYGLDISGSVVMLEGSAYGSLSGRGLLSYTRGRNLDSGDDLYKIMPPNLKLALDHRLGAWRNTVELKLVDEKRHVQDVRKELKTAGYGLLNVYSSYEWQRVRLDVGIENLLDKGYDDPLGGAYLGQGATMGTGVVYGTALPGMGRSINTSLTYTF